MPSQTLTPLRCLGRAVASASWAAFGLFGCSSTVVLGSECPEQRAGCVLELSASDARAPERDSQGKDASSSEGEAEDAGSPREEDAGNNAQDAEMAMLRDAEPSDASSHPNMDTGIAAELRIVNPGFQRSGTGGLGGDVVLSSLIGTLIPVPSIKIIFADLPGWYACWPLSVNSWTREAGDAGTPETRNDYLSFTVGEMPVPVRQALSNPMEVDTRYALEMDVLSQPDNGAQLRVEVRGSADQCGIGTLLGSSPAIPEDAGWTTTCVEFTSKVAYDYLMIVPAYDGGVPTLAARLLLDNVRQVAACSRVQ